jgi:hypothetical protein
LHGLGGRDAYTAPAPVTGPNLLSNGDFETGDFTGWVRSGGGNGDANSPQVVASFADPVSAMGTLLPSTGGDILNGGTRFAIFNVGSPGTNSEVDCSLYQQIALPTLAANERLYLRFIWSPIDRNNNVSDKMEILVKDATGANTLVTINSAALGQQKPGPWQSFVSSAGDLPFDISAAAGQTARIFFRLAPANFTSAIYFGLDNVQVFKQTIFPNAVMVNRAEDLTRAAAPVAGLTLRLFDANAPAGGRVFTISGVTYDPVAQVNTFSLLTPPPANLAGVRWHVEIPSAISGAGNYLLPNSVHSETEVGGQPVVLFGPGRVEIVRQYLEQLIKAAGVKLDVQLVGDAYVHPGAAPVKLQSIAVTPASLTVARGKQQQLTATGKYTDGSTKDHTSVVAWSVSHASRATVSPAGVLTGVAAGSLVVIAKHPSGPAGTTVVTIS